MGLKAFYSVLFYSILYLLALTQVALQEGQRRPVAKVHGQLGVDLPLQFHQLPDPVDSQEGEVWETLVHRASEEGKESRKEGTLIRRTCDGDAEPGSCSAVGT